MCIYDYRPYATYGVFMFLAHYQAHAFCFVEVTYTFETCK
jgi:hypothetical protein